MTDIMYKSVTAIKTPFTVNSIIYIITCSTDVLLEL